jgi:hypothetical protein
MMRGKNKMRADEPTSIHHNAISGGCAFLSSPLGEKYCHNERQVSTRRWATSTTGNPIVSYDDGKTWSVFTPDATATVPKVPTVQEVHISWKKIDD